MEFTTQFELQSQTTRLVETMNIVTSLRQERESHPLSCLFPKDLARDTDKHCFYRPQLGTDSLCTDSHGEHFPLQSPLLGESWLVSFPPLNYMLKFSGSSCLSWDQKIGWLELDVQLLSLVTITTRGCTEHSLHTEQKTACISVEPNMALPYSSS